MTYPMCVAFGITVFHVELLVRPGFAEPGSDSKGEARYPRVLMYNDRV